jgi:hypothetical protein
VAGTATAAVPTMAAAAAATATMGATDSSGGESPPGLSPPSIFTQPHSPIFIYPFHSPSHLHISF